MIDLDKDYDDAESATKGDYKRPPAGGYILKCTEVASVKSSNGNPMVELSLDIADGEFKGAFERYPLIYRQVCNGESTKFLKGMITAFQHSNPKMLPAVRNGQFDPITLRGCYVGGSLQEEEYYNKGGELKTSIKPAFLCGIDRVQNREIDPLPKKEIAKLPSQSSNDFTGGISAPPIDDNVPPIDDLPF